MYFSRWVEMVFSLVTNNRPKRRVVFLLIIATSPAGIAGVLVDDLVSGIFSSLRSVGISLLITALVLWLGEWIGKKRKDQNVKYLGALWIGVFQACALVPGISRSGLTISAGRSVGLSRSDALDFSFLMLVPILMGAILLTGLDIINENIAIPDINILVVGFISSCAVSIAALLFLKKFVRSHSLSWFSVYLIVIGLVLIFLEL
jgi:undecaprenyl-diphosphatase